VDYRLTLSDSRLVQIEDCCGLQLIFLCLYTSAFYHVFRTYSVGAYVVLLTLDIQGITMQIFGSTFLAVYFELICFPFWQKVYLSLLIILGFLTALFVPFLVRTRKTNWRTFILVCFAGIGLISWIHHFFLIDLHYNKYNSHSLFALLGTYAWVLFGLLIRRVHIPERFSPGTFDVWFSSHQLFHIAVVIGSTTLYFGYKQIHEWQVHTKCVEMHHLF